MAFSTPARKKANGDWWKSSGISTSICAGLRSIHDVADAVLVLLADQPLITVEHLKKLMAEWQENTDCIVASQYSDTLGPPALFPSKYFAALSGLEGDKGARRLLETAGEAVRKIEFADGAIDIDTPDDLVRINQRY